MNNQDKILKLRSTIGQCQNMIKAGYHVSRAKEDLENAKVELNQLEWDEAYRMEGIR